MPTHYIQSSRQAVDIICNETMKRFYLQIPNNVILQTMIGNIRSMLYKYDLHVKLRDAKFENRKVIMVVK